MAAEPLRWIELSRAALRDNVRAVRERIGNDRKLMAVVKANAYGHGAVLCAREYLAAGADALGVATVEEGLELREAGCVVPIHIIAAMSAADAAEVVEHDLNPVIFDETVALALDAAARKAGKMAEISLKLETGMHRHGLSAAELERLLAVCARCPGLRVTGIATHFARSDEEEDGPTLEQFARLRPALEKCRAAGNALPLCHAASSAASLLLPETHLDMVRCGISLYGLYPSAAVLNKLGEGTLRPVLEFKTRIAQLRDLYPGDAVSYGGTWTAKRQSRIAVLPVGYADGYRRGLSNRAHVLVRGKPAPVTGRVCMNILMADVTDIPEAAAGDVVTLISRDPQSGATADDHARLLDTINYEVVTGLNCRMPRLLTD